MGREEASSPVASPSEPAGLLLGVLPDGVGPGDRYVMLVGRGLRGPSQFLPLPSAPPALLLSLWLAPHPCVPPQAPWAEVPFLYHEENPTKVGFSVKGSRNHGPLHPALGDFYSLSCWLKSRLGLRWWCYRVRCTWACGVPAVGPHAGGE